MICIICSSNTDVVNSRPNAKTSTVWRRRRCNSCKEIFTTREKPDYFTSIKTKKDSRSSKPFNEDKLFLSLYQSLSHRKDATEAARQLTDTILSKAFPTKSDLIETSQLFTIAYPVLKRFDSAAAVYYKSHHLNK